MNIVLPRRYGLVIERWQIYIYKGPDWEIIQDENLLDIAIGAMLDDINNHTIEINVPRENVKMNWFMLGVHISRWLPRIRYENIKEF